MMYGNEKKNKGGLSARKVTDLVIVEFGVSPTTRDTQRYVKYGIIGQYPLKKGCVGDFHPFVLNALCTYFEIFIKTIKSTVNTGRITLQS